MNAKPSTYRTHLKDEAATTLFGQQLGSVLRAGDTLLLNGPVGAGKSHLARAIIGSLLVEDEHIPSPTYTIIQTYQTTRGELWHADLYRLADSSELSELGLDEALGHAITLIEWPDRLPDKIKPEDALAIDLSLPDSGRNVVMHFQSERWNELESFLENG